MVGQVNRGVCRIIAGKWRGRKIKFDDAEGLRPTTDRIRETVFNWLQPYLSQSRCLDCFAGSGVLGFEALSRGAQELVFIEQNVNTIKCLKDNVQTLAIENVVIHQQDALAELDKLKQKGLIRAFGMSTKTVEGGLWVVENCDVVMATCNLEYDEEQTVLDKAKELKSEIQ